jgi:hypothetical protein
MASNSTNLLIARKSLLGVVGPNVCYQIAGPFKFSKLQSLKNPYYSTVVLSKKKPYIFLPPSSDFMLVRLPKSDSKSEGF